MPKKTIKQLKKSRRQLKRAPSKVSSKTKTSTPSVGKLSSKNLKQARKLGFVGRFVKGAAKAPGKFVDKAINKQKIRDKAVRERNKKTKERADKKFRKR